MRRKGPKGPRVRWWRYPAVGMAALLAFGDADRLESTLERWSRRDDPKWWAELDAMLADLGEDRWEWRLGATARDREIGVEIGCTGSPQCCAAIHIRRTRSDDPTRAPSWEEIHLTENECRWVIGELHLALRRRQ